MHKVIHRSVPGYLVELLPNTVNAITSYNLRNKDDFDQLDLHSEKLRKSLLPGCIRRWNSLDKKREMKVDVFENLMLFMHRFTGIICFFFSCCILF